MASINRNSSQAQNDNVVLNGQVPADIIDGSSDDTTVEVSDTGTQTADENSPSSSQEDYAGFTVDAIHPRFQTKKTTQIIQKSVSVATNQYYCRLCHKYFDNINSIGVHFRTGKHAFTTSCVYCKGPVFKYVYNEEECVLHECRVDGVGSDSQVSSSTSNGSASRQSSQDILSFSESEILQ